MQETLVWSLSWEDILEKEMVTYSSILAWEILGQRSLAGYSPWGRKRVGCDLATKQQCMGKFKTLGSLKPFLWSAPQLSGASILCFHILSFLGVHHGEWPQSDHCQKESILSFLNSLRAHPLTFSGGCNPWWFGTLCLLTWPEIVHFSSNSPHAICL